MFIETTFMRYGHGSGGLVGITLNPSALKRRWTLSLHICSRLDKNIEEMRDQDTYTHVLTHKEERPARVLADAQDRQNIRDKLNACIDPLNPDVHPDIIINIITGRISKYAVNVDKAVSVGRQQMYKSEIAQSCIWITRKVCNWLYTFDNTQNKLDNCVTI
jgi:hypothetical protein